MSARNLAGKRKFLKNMPKNNLNNFLNNNRRDASLLLVKQCPLCNRVYLPEHLVILDDSGGTFLAHLSCSNCGSHLIIRVVASPNGLIGTASITDLIADEVIAFNENEVISADDVLDLSGMIKENSLKINNYFLANLLADNRNKLR